MCSKSKNPKRLINVSISTAVEELFSLNRCPTACFWRWYFAGIEIRYSCCMYSMTHSTKVLRMLQRWLSFASRKSRSDSVTKTRNVKITFLYVVIPMNTQWLNCLLFLWREVVIEFNMDFQNLQFLRILPWTWLE